MECLPNSIHSKKQTKKIVPLMSYINVYIRWSGASSFAEAKISAENRTRWRARVANLRFEDGT